MSSLSPDLNGVVVGAIVVGAAIVLGMGAVVLGMMLPIGRRWLSGRATMGAYTHTTTTDV